VLRKERDEEREQEGQQHRHAHPPKVHAVVTMSTFESATPQSARRSLVAHVNVQRAWREQSSYRVSVSV
jgi:hypothetical protein